MMMMSLSILRSLSPLLLTLPLSPCVASSSPFAAAAAAAAAAVGTAAAATDVVVVVAVVAVPAVFSSVIVQVQVVAPKEL